MLLLISLSLLVSPNINQHPRIDLLLVHHLLLGMYLYLLPQYCGITILIDVCSNVSNPQEKKDGGDVKQGEI